MDRPRVQYTTADDGTQIAYYERGTGPSFLYELTWRTSSIEWEIKYQNPESLFDVLSRSARLVRFDHRCGGLSQRDAHDPGVHGFVRDLEAVIGATQLTDFVHFAWQCGVQPAIVHAATRAAPTKLILWDPVTPRPCDDQDWARIDRLIDLANVDWEAYCVAHSYRPADGDAVKLAARCLQENAFPGDFVRSHLARYQFDLRPFVSQVHCPTLVVSTRSATLAAAQYYARTIPNAELVCTDGDGNYHPLRVADPAAVEIIGYFAGLEIEPDHLSSVGGSYAGVNGASNGHYSQALAVLVGDTPTANPGGLSDRELEVLCLIARGLTNAEIAGALVLSEHTVKRHVSNVLTKIGAANRARAAAWATEVGIVRDVAE